MAKLLAFHGDQAIKDKYVARVQAHYDADEIIKGTYWEKGKGCAVGCTIEGNDHDRYETELGIPRLLAHLEDSIFENLPNSEAKEFPLRFLKAIKPGADLSLVVSKLVVWQFEDNEHGLKNIKEVKADKEVFGFCKEVVALYKRKIAGEQVSQKEFEDLYWRIDRAGARAWAWAWAWAWARAWARAGAGARAWAWAWAWAWARAWARAGARASYDEHIIILANKLIELLEEAE